ncbi:MAG: NERD domain-containing protein [Clostridia bacterium]|nr:NERD domain-containing protein [Clostridia bacterium]
MLFDQFTDTVFLKDDTSLEKQCNALERLNKEYPNNKEIEEELYIAKKGLEGENEIKYQLKKANIGMYVLQDVNFEYNDLKAQIDFIVITKAHCYFIECKNLVGNITINDKGEFIREYKINGKTIRKGMYSPITQVEQQREVYKKIWDSTWNTKGLIEQVKRKFAEKNFFTFHRTLVVAANPDTILKNHYAPLDIKRRVIRADMLIRKIQDDIISSDKDLWDKPKESLKWANHFLSNNINKDNNYYEIYQKKYVKEPIIDTTDLRKKLVEFREARAKEKNMPLHYIFTDTELDIIIEVLPHSLKELYQSNILPEIKIKTHGEKIIEIINNWK